MFPFTEMMKSCPFLNKTRVAAAVLAVFSLALSSAMAQMPGGSVSMMNSAMLKLFGDNTAFTSKAEIHVLDAAHKETDTFPFGFALWDGKMRMDLDFNQVKAANIPPAVLPTLKQLGMDQTVMIMRPDKKIVIAVYPRVKCYAEIPMSKDDIAASEKTYTVAKSSLGKETVDGAACAKSKVTLTDEKGVKHDAIVWTTASPKDFPVQIQMTEQDSTLLMKFKDVKLGKPDSAKFEAPGGLTKYKSAEALMDAATKGTLVVSPAK